MERARAVCSFIKVKLPHVVFLQEVVDSTWVEITRELSSAYHCFTSRLSTKYYVVTLVHRATAEIAGEVNCLDFASSRMGRRLLQVPIRFANVQIFLMNSHMESMDSPPCVRERLKQLEKSFDVMETVCEKHPEMSCVFAGDLNLLDEDVKQVWQMYINDGY